MSASRTKFYLDKQNGKVFGVCAGIADYTGIDVLLVRIGTVILTFATGWALLVYLVIAWAANNKPYGLYEDAADAKFWQGVRSNPKRSTAEVRSKFRDIDRRLADIEMVYTSRNQRLADEIDRLR
ncbi:MAG: envelope stress response membrane protein PspC [Sphingomonas sp.]|uniref:envelope stress response membrane protein PspC n=1 Tax=Sphingomonas TaxID=13687 RepID=UPI00082A3932|nr:envelope stress response membrane protein PspC [Sphingomonas sp. CCH10-B3]MBA3880667.1 PspC domain-containing protein [Sphingobium sp.]MBX9858235.1 envelope stress response membrane protein PspC [Sphingomonas sp.]